MLPNINGKQAAQTAPGTDPNQRAKSTGSLLGQYSNTMLSQLADTISPSNFVRQGTYGAFGNNVLTRSAMGIMDTSSDLLDKFLGIDKGEEDSSTDKLLKEQIKLLTKTTEEIDDTNQILKELLEVEKTKISETGKKSEPEESEIKDIKKKKKKSKIEPRHFKDALQLQNDSSIGLHSNGDKGGMLATIARDVVEIKDILINGFESVSSVLDKDSDGNYNGFKKGKRKLHDVEDATIISETKYGNRKEPDFVKKYRIANLKLLKHVADGVDKIYSVISQGGNLDQAEVDAESQRREKHMGMAQEVPTDVPKLEGPKLPDSPEGGGVSGAITAVIALLMTQMENLKSLIVDMFKSGIEKFKGALETAWEFGKDTVSKAFSWVKEKGGSLLESAEKAAGEIGEKIAGKGGLKAIAKKGLGSAIKAIPVVGELAAAGLAAYDGWDASKNAKDILGIEGREATTGEKVEAGIGGAVESISFGLISKEKTAKWIDGLMSDKNDKQDELTKKQEDLNRHTQDKVAPPADAAGAPSVSVNTTNNTYNSGRKLARNDDSSYNRYLDRHYAF